MANWRTAEIGVERFSSVTGVSQNERAKEI